MVKCMAVWFLHSQQTETQIREPTGCVFSKDSLKMFTFMHQFSEEARNMFCISVTAKSTWEEVTAENLYDGLFFARVFQTVLTY